MGLDCEDTLPGRHTFNYSAFLTYPFTAIFGLETLASLCKDTQKQAVSQKGKETHCFFVSFLH